MNPVWTVERVIHYVDLIYESSVATQMMLDKIGGSKLELVMEMTLQGGKGWCNLWVTWVLTSPRHLIHYAHGR